MKSRKFLKYIVGDAKHFICYQEMAAFSSLVKQVHVILNSGKEIIIRDVDGKVFDDIWNYFYTS